MDFELQQYPVVLTFSNPSNNLQFCFILLMRLIGMGAHEQNNNNQKSGTRIPKTIGAMSIYKAL